MTRRIVAACLALAVLPWGCRPSTTGLTPTPRPTATHDTEDAVVVTYEHSTIDRSGSKAGGSDAARETRKAFETGLPYAAELAMSVLKGGGTGSGVADLLPVTAFTKGFHALEDYFNRDANAKITTTTTTVVWRSSAGPPKKIDIDSKGVEITGPDGQPVDAATDDGPDPDAAVVGDALTAPTVLPERSEP